MNGQLVSWLAHVLELAIPGTNWHYMWMMIITLTITYIMREDEKDLNRASM